MVAAAYVIQILVWLIGCKLPTSTPDTPKQDFWISCAATTTILSTIQILSYNDLLLYTILVTVIFCNFNKTIHMLSEDGAETPKHVGAFVI
jgi:hypothetical protein